MGGQCKQVVWAVTDNIQEQEHFCGAFPDMFFWAQVGSNSQTNRRSQIIVCFPANCSLLTQTDPTIIIPHYSLPPSQYPYPLTLVGWWVLEPQLTRQCMGQTLGVWDIALLPCCPITCTDVAIVVVRFFALTPLPDYPVCLVLPTDRSGQTERQDWAWTGNWVQCPQDSQLNPLNRQTADRPLHLGP